jgi:outer membrane receptor protein involved in Fe transport
MVNPLAQLTGMLPNRLGPLAPTPALVNNPAGNPDDLRKTALDFTPIYEADETLLTLRYTHEFEKHTFAAVAGYQDTSVSSLNDYTMSLGQSAAPSPLLSFLPFTQPAYNAFFADGCLPISAPSKNGTGIIGGHIGGCTNSMDAYDRSNQETDQTTFEARISSNYDGMFNFLAGAFYMEADTFNEYWVIATGLDYFAVVFPSIPVALGGAIGVPGVGMVGPSYINRTNGYDLESQAVFGELYFQLRDDLKLTLGARYTDDTKEIDAVQTLLGNGVLPFGTDSDFLAGKNTIDDADWQETTGRVVLDWTPDIEFTDATLVYASYSRGYKGGGFNPPIDRTLAINQGIPETFEPEFIDSYEIGMKNTMLGNTLQLNLSAFFYDYEGLQVSKIFNRTSLNENTDAEISGFETELLFAPDEHWQFNANLSYLDTEIQDFQSVDTRDPSAGLNGNGVTVLKDNANASNCVLHWNGAPAPVMNPINNCAAPRDLAGNLLLAPGSPYTVDTGVPRDVSGNQLGNAPEWQFSAGAQYRFRLPADYSLTARIDYFWQEEMYARIFNQPIDKIDSWDIWNAQATLMSPDESWFLRAFVKNINDDDNIVGQYVTDPSSGMFTNVFLIEPRTYGLAAGYSF